MYKKITVGVFAALLATGCATQSQNTEPKKAEPMYEKGLGVPKDIQKALYFVEKGCQLNHGQSCSRAGNFYDHGYAGVVDKEKAAFYYMKGCELNDGLACNNIGLAYADGEGVVKNLALAETYLQKALRLGNNAYNNLGFLYQMKGDIVKAEDYYKKGYKQLVNVPNPGVTMFKLDSNSCEMQNKTGCSNLAFDYEKGIGVAKNMKKAKLYYKKACKLGNKESCNK